MIKNKLYPYIEQYINDYLWGFTKEQFEVGVLNGIISLENIHLRPDIINNQLNKSEIPLWLKAGRIGKIKVGCSLMNFIGEKPLEAEISDIDLVFSPSYKYIFKNKRNPITDTELKLEYDATRFNSNNIFDRKIKIYDGSVLHINDNCNYYQDKTQLSKIINQILDLCIKYYTIKPYAINGTITNIHIRFEDDELIYPSTANKIAFGIIIKLIKVSLSAEGLLKKNNFSIEEMNIYSDNNPNIFILTDYFLKSLNKQGFIIDESYYRTIYKINFKQLVCNLNKANIIEVKSIKVNIGINSTNKSNLNIFSNQDVMNMTVNFSITIDTPLTIHILPQIVNSFKDIILFTKDFKTLKYLNDFRPKYCPIVNNKSLTAYFLCQDDINFRLKKQQVVRDWLFYLFWFTQFKKVFQASSNNSERSQLFRNAFNRYMNIQVLNSKEVEMKVLNDDIQIIKSNYNVKTYCINPPTNNKNVPLDRQLPECLIQLNMIIEIKQVKIYVYDTTLLTFIQNQSKFCMIAIDDNSFTCFISKDQCQCDYSFKNLIIETKETYNTTNKEIPKHEDFKLLKQSKLLTSNPQSNLYSISNNTTSITLNRRLHQHLTIPPKINPINGISAGLKISPLVEDTRAIHKSNMKTFQHQAKSAKRMKTLCKTLNLSNSTNTQSQPFRIPKDTHQKNTGSFIAFLLNSNEESTKIQQEREEEKLRTEASISKAIREYNNKKNKILNKSVNNSLCLDQSVNSVNENNSNMIRVSNNNSFLSKSPNKKNNNNNVSQSFFSIVNNKIQQIKDDFPLSLLSIKLNDSMEYGCKLSFKKKNISKTPDILSLNIGNMRINVFASYLKDLFDIMTGFNLGMTYLNQANYDQAKEMRDKRYFFLMKKYIYNQCLKNLRNNPNELLLKYTNYIRENCMMSFFQEEEVMNQSAFDLSYFFSYYFSEGIEIDMNYNRIDVLCYNREQSMNDLLARTKIPPINFKLELTLSNSFIQFFDFEFDIIDYDGITETINDLIDTFNAKLRRVKKVIEPALKLIKQSIIKEKEDNNLKKSINSSIMKNNSSNVYTKTLSISNNHQPVNLKILTKNTDNNLNNNSTIDSNFFQNRPNTIINSPNLNNNQSRNNHTVANTLSLFKSSERNNVNLFSKNTLN